MTALRAQEEIVERWHQVADEDVFGFRREALSSGLTFDTAKSLDVLADGAQPWEPPTAESVEKIARDYLDFAYGKAIDHRGISASRSVEKLREHAWLLGRDDVVTAMDAADYQNYGAPQLKAFAEGMCWPWSDEPELNRMAEGLPCSDRCEEGCGL